MNILTFDTETTTGNKGHVYDQANYMVTAGFLYNNEYIESMDAALIRQLFDEADLIVGFNLKFDLAWIRRTFGIVVRSKQVWDVQLAHYIHSCQEATYPSLNSVAEHYGIEGKLDIVKAEYWDKGIDTPDIPKDTLSMYLKQDVMLTYQLYVLQTAHNEKTRLIRQSCWDLLCLSEMEWNGMLYDMEGSTKEATNYLSEIEQMTLGLNDAIHATINWDSPKQVSAVLYGGEITYEEKEEYVFTYKDAKKPPVVKQKNVSRSVFFPRLVEPPKSDKEETQYSVADGTLNSLKPKGKAKVIIDIITKRSKLTKLVGTYFNGIPQRSTEYGWTGNIVHAQLNQCQVITGRLSSSKPNVQNIPKAAKKYFISRF